MAFIFSLHLRIQAIYHVLPIREPPTFCEQQFPSWQAKGHSRHKLNFKNLPEQQTNENQFPLVYKKFYPQWCTPISTSEVIGKISSSLRMRKALKSRFLRNTSHTQVETTTCIMFCILQCLYFGSRTYGPGQGASRQVRATHTRARLNVGTLIGKTKQLTRAFAKRCINICILLRTATQHMNTVKMAINSATLVAH